MNTEQAFNLSVALTTLVMLLVSLLIREDDSRLRAIGSFRLAMLANMISWLMFMTPAGSIPWLLSYPGAAAHLWFFVLFAWRRAQRDVLVPAIAMIVLHSTAYLWASLHGGLVARLHVGAAFYALGTAAVCHSMLRLKRPRTFSDIGVAASFLALLLFAVARSVLIVTRPDILDASAYLLYVIWPAFYTASGMLALTGYLEEAQHRHREQALRDPLTGLLNRRGFDEHRTAVLAYAARQSLPVTLIALDIDRFKGINDNFGHEAGDSVLRAVAEVIHREMRTVDLSARFGGEEFLVLLAYGDHETGIACAERMRIAMQECEIAAAAGAVRFSASFGVASAPGSEDFEQIYRRADEALYRAKAAGRNRVEVESTATA